MNGPKFRDLEALALRGAVMKNTRLTEKFTADDFFATYGQSARILFIDHPEKGLIPLQADSDPQTLPPGTAIHALVPEETATASDSQATHSPPQEN